MELNDNNPKTQSIVYAIDSVVSFTHALKKGIKTNNQNVNLFLN